MKLIENFFNLDECNSAINEIETHSDQIYQCSETDMYILGNSLLRNQSNNYLENNTFDFETIKLFREKLLTLFPKIEFTKKLGKPGFQIIKQNETHKPCVWHYDSILVCFPYEVEFKDYKNNFKNYFDDYYIFTLMLSDSPSSFDYFPETKSNFGNSPTDEVETPVCKSHVDLIGDVCLDKDCQLKDYKTITYSQGSLLIQNERVLHRVGIQDINGNSSSRITIQSYGLVKDGIMYLCW